MAYALRAGLSFCEVEGRLIFLDLPADRYFCLGLQAEAAFARIWRRDPCDPGDSQFANRCGLLTEGARASIDPCPAPVSCTRSLMEEDIHRARTVDWVRMLTSLVRASLNLRLFGLAATIAQLETTKSANPGNTGYCGLSTRLTAAASTVRACMRLVSFHERCLPASLALASELARVGIPAHLVLGVRLNPFKAHAWVQYGDILVNERLGIARLFTPILVL